MGGQSIQEYFIYDTFGVFFLYMRLLHAWKYWRFYSKLIKDKQRQHDLVLADICFLEQAKGVDKFDGKIADMRDALKIFQSKEGDKDQKKINELAYQIAEFEDLQKKYKRMIAVADELAQYVQIIGEWKNDVWQKAKFGE